MTDVSFEDGLVKGADGTDGTNAAEGLDGAYEKVPGGPVDDPGKWTNVPKIGSQTPGGQNDKNELLELLDQVKAGLAEIAQDLENIHKTFETYKVVGECTATIRQIAGIYPATGDMNKDVYSLALDRATTMEPLSSRCLSNELRLMKHRTRSAKRRSVGHPPSLKSR